MVQLVSFGGDLRNAPVTGGGGQYGGSRSYLIQMDNTTSNDEDIASINYEINYNSKNNTLFNTINNIENMSTITKYNHPSIPSYKAEASRTIKYVDIDCSGDVTIQLTTNLSFGRPGVVSTCYLVPLNTLTTTGINNEGNSYDTLLQYLDVTTQYIPESKKPLLAQYGMGYRDAQSSNVNPSIEIDLFEMTSCGFQTTLHGMLSGATVNQPGFFCNVNGQFGTDYQSTATFPISYFVPQDSVSPGEPEPDDDDPLNAYNNPPSDALIYAEYFKNNVLTHVQPTNTNIYGPTDDFIINNTKNFDITNELHGYKSTTTIALFNQLYPSQTYSEEDGWLYMITTLTQGVHTIKMYVLSPGFNKYTGIHHMNLVVSEWGNGQTAWLDGVQYGRGYVQYLEDEDTSPIQFPFPGITYEVYNNLAPIYQNNEYVLNVVNNSTDKPIPPSLFILGNIIISGLDMSKSYGLTLDVLFRGIDDSKLNASPPTLLWTGQYATAYGLRYTEININELLLSLVNVPTVVDTSSVSGNNWTTAMTTPMENIGDEVEMEPDATVWIGGDPGSWYTNQPSFEGDLSMNYVQTVYSLLYNIMNPVDGIPISQPIPYLLSKVMTEDGINYIVFKST